MKILISNIIVLIASIVMVYAGYVKSKRKILILQSLQYGLTVISNIIVKGYSGAVINTLGIIRNILGYKEKLTNIVKVILIILSFLLTLKFNNSGIIGYLPFMASMLYILFMNIKDVINFKVLNIIMTAMWLIYDFSICLYVGALFDGLCICSNVISIFQIKSRAKKLRKISKKVIKRGTKKKSKKA